MAPALLAERSVGPWRSPGPTFAPPPARPWANHRPQGGRRGRHVDVTMVPWRNTALGRGGARGHHPLRRLQGRGRTTAPRGGRRGGHVGVTVAERGGEGGGERVRPPIWPVRHPKGPVGQPVVPVRHPIGPVGHPVGPVGQPVGPVRHPVGHPIGLVGHPIGPVRLPRGGERRRRRSSEVPCRGWCLVDETTGLAGARELVTRFEQHCEGGARTGSGCSRGLVRRQRRGRRGRVGPKALGGPGPGPRALWVLGLQGPPGVPPLPGTGL